MGRQLIAAMDEQMQERLPDWRLSVRDHRDIAADAITSPENSGISAALSASGGTASRLHRPNQTDLDLAINQTLAGSLLADVLLRRGFRYFRWESGPIDTLRQKSNFAAGFSDEMVRADLKTEDHFQPTIGSDSAKIPTIAATTAPGSPASAIGDLDSLSSAEGECPRVTVSPCPHWLSSAVIDQICRPSAVAADRAASPPLIPPVLACSASEIDRLPAHFSDNLIAEVSRRIDAALRRSESTDAARLSAELNTARRTLERRFRDALGTSIHREITRRQIALARTHLLLPGVTPSRAARLSGYASTRMLSINFRKLHNLSPRAFQRLHLNAWSKGCHRFEAP